MVRCIQSSSSWTTAGWADVLLQQLLLEPLVVIMWRHVSILDDRYGILNTTFLLISFRHFWKLGKHVCNDVTPWIFLSDSCADTFWIATWTDSVCRIRIHTTNCICTYEITPMHSHYSHFLPHDTSIHMQSLLNTSLFNSGHAHLLVLLVV